jgi:hypothetical protein
MTIVRLQEKALPVVKTINKELEELDAQVKWYLTVGDDVHKAIELSRRWRKLARAGGLIR